MKKYVNGSFTVEIALIFPIVLFVIMSLIYMTFYLHDTIYIKGVIDKACIKEGMVIKHTSNFVTGEIAYEEINQRGILFFLLGDLSKEEEILDKYLEEKLKNGLFIVQIEDVKTEVNHLETKISVKAEMNIPFVEMRKYLGGSNVSESIVGGAPVHNPAEYARIIEVIYDTASNIKGFDQLKEKLQKLISVFK